ncbi:pyridoxamine 5'-phosphate oxidase family protein [Gorillibacterium massiliense]|uniref:pyridoxamine 5'-phosphate oxidase family protein n=1 Tax=Gorillibacterium massiliense TaxID=1280390 RepID=UPI0004AE951D|nr:pyridoxamine 5'-phosphate oxidase family protein [Gorillibacterium massiliense]
MAETLAVLSEQQFSLLQQEKFVLLGTVDAESGAPHASAISWIYAAEPSRLRFAVDHRSSIISNIKANPKVTATFFGGGGVNVIYGSVRVVSEELDDVPIKLSCLDIEIESVRNAMFYGSRITVEPEYEKTYDRRAADKLDGQVFEAMNKA